LRADSANTFNGTVSNANVVTDGIGSWFATVGTNTRGWLFGNSSAYDQAQARGRTAARLDQQRPNALQMSVANILPGYGVRVELRYGKTIVPPGKANVRRAVRLCERQQGGSDTSPSAAGSPSVAQL